MRMKQDLVNWLGDNLIDMVESHLEVWKDRYYRLTLKEILADLSLNYDFSADLDCVADGIGRELTSDEQVYFINCFYKSVKLNFYKNEFKGW